MSTGTMLAPSGGNEQPICRCTLASGLAVEVSSVGVRQNDFIERQMYVLRFEDRPSDKDLQDAHQAVAQMARGQCRLRDEATVARFGDLRTSYTAEVVVQIARAVTHA